MFGSKAVKPLRFALLVTLSLAAFGQGFAAQMQYDALGRLTSIDYGNGNLIEYTYDAQGNRLGQRITGTALPNPSARLAVTPASQQLAWYESTPSLQITNTGNGTLVWLATVTSGVAWLSITSAASGSGNATLHLLATANRDTLDRTGSVRIEAPGAVDPVATVNFMQAGRKVPSAIADPLLADRFHVRQNAPNPFNPSTTIEFAVPHATVVTLRVFDLSGRLVRTLIRSESYGQGWHSAVWSGRDDAKRQVSAGVYFYRFEAPGFTKTGRMVLLK